MKKTLTIFFITIIMCVMNIPFVYASNNISLSVMTDKTEVLPGDQIVFTVSLNNAVNIEKMQFTFNYDADVLEYKSRSFGTIMSGASYKQAVSRPDEQKVGFIATMRSGYTGSGDVCKFTFIVKDDATSGAISYSITNTLFGASGEESVPIEFDSDNSSSVIIPGEETGGGSVPEPPEEEDPETGTTEAPITISATTEVANIGDSVTYSIDMSDVRLNAIQFDLVYPGEYLEFVSCMIDANISDEVMSAEYYDDIENSHTRLIVVNYDDFSVNNVAKITYKIKEAAVSKSISIALDNVKLANSNGAVIATVGTCPIVVVSDYNEDLVNEVIDLINSIGQVTLDSESVIIAAENAYESLSDTNKELVTNYEILTSARAELNILKQFAEATVIVNADKSEVGYGEDLKFSVDFSSMKLKKIEYDLAYPNEYLEFISHSVDNSILENALSVKCDDSGDTGYAHFTIDFNDEFVIDGNVAEFTFKVKKNVENVDINIYLENVLLSHGSEVFSVTNVTYPQVKIVKSWDYKCVSLVDKVNYISAGLEIKESAEKARMIIAFYEDDENVESRLIDVYSYDITGWIGEQLISFKAPLDADLVTVFLLDGNNILCPLGSAKKLHLE